MNDQITALERLLEPEKSDAIEMHPSSDARVVFLEPRGDPDNAGLLAVAPGR